MALSAQTIYFTFAVDRFIQRPWTQKASRRACRGVSTDVKCYLIRSKINSLSLHFPHFFHLVVQSQEHVICFKIKLIKN